MSVGGVDKVRILPYFRAPSHGYTDPFLQAATWSPSFQYFTFPYKVIFRTMASCKAGTVHFSWCECEKIRILRFNSFWHEKTSWEWFWTVDCRELSIYLRKRNEKNSSGYVRTACKYIEDSSRAEQSLRGWEHLKRRSVRYQLLCISNVWEGEMNRSKGFMCVLLKHLVANGYNMKGLWKERTPKSEHSQLMIPG